MRLLRLLLVPGCVLFTACGGEAPAAGASASAGGSAAPVAKSTATPPASAAAPSVPAATPTLIEIAGAGGAKKVSLVLPPNVVEIPDDPTSRSFRKGKDDFDGYALNVMEDRPERAKAGPDPLVAQLQAQPATKKTRLIEKATWEGGWAVAFEFEEGGKKNVTVMASTTAGGTAYTCRGDATGSALTDPDAAGKLLMASCRSIAPAS